MQQPAPTQQNTPAYLAPPRYCPVTTTLAILLTLVMAGLVGYLALNGRSFLFHAGIDYQLKIAIELAFILLCTMAVWKHARRA